MENKSVYTYTGKAQGGKLLRLTLEIEPPLTRDSIIRSIAIHGDFFAHPEDAFDELEQFLVGKPINALSTWFVRGLDQLNITVYGLLPEDLDIAIAQILS